MSVKFEEIDRTLIAHIDGDIDHHSAEELRDNIDKLVERRKVKSLVLDFSKVSFMDSSGIGMVIGRYKLIKSRGGRFAVCSMSKNVGRIFELSGLNKIIPFYETLKEAAFSMKKQEA